LVHFVGYNHFVPKVKNRAHVRTFLGSCFAEMFVAADLRDRIRMGYLVVTELCGQMSANLLSVTSADTNKYFPVKSAVIPCGFDLYAFHPSSTKSANPSILFVGIRGFTETGKETS
jgi:hypothetical protein